MKQIEIVLTSGGRAFPAQKLNHENVINFPYISFDPNHSIHLFDDSKEKLNFIEVNEKVSEFGKGVQQFNSQIIIIDSDIVGVGDFVKRKYYSPKTDRLSLIWCYSSFLGLELNENVFELAINGFKLIGNQAKMGHLAYDLRTKDVFYKNNRIGTAHNLGDLVSICKLLGMPSLKFSKNLKIIQKEGSGGFRVNVGIDSDIYLD